MLHTEESLAIVNRWIAAFNAHDVAAIVALYADNAELSDPGMKKGLCRGRAEIEQWFTTRFRTMPTIAYTPHEQIAADEYAVVTWTARAINRGLLGIPRTFQVDGVSVFTLRDGLIQRQRGYYDHLAAVEQILPLVKLLPSRV
jgi:steroid delta-isomerase-like uncharacterized protein